MSEFFELFVASIFSVISFVYASSKILKRKVNLESETTIIAIISMMFITPTLFQLSDNFVRVIVNLSCLIIMNILIFQKEKLKLFLTSFLIYILFTISEILFCSTAMLIFQLNMQQYQIIFFGNPAANLAVSLLVAIIVNIPFVFKKFYYFINIKTNFKKRFILLIIILGILLSTLAIYSAYFKLNNVQLMILIFFFIVAYTFIIFRLFYENKEREYVQNKNLILIKKIIEYEKIKELQKIEAHENKNQLIIIKGMLNDTNIKLQEYIDVLLKEYKEKDKSLLNKVQNIPNGGVRALIYAKLVKLNDNYNVSLIVSREINTKLLDFISPETNVDICKILGVFLDNAIESAQMSNEKVIGIELYVQNGQFKIKISNTYNNELDLEKIDLPSYSTKGNGRGYGLTLVKQIVSQNKDLTNSRMVNKNIFSQILSINLNNFKF